MRIQMRYMLAWTMLGMGSAAGGCLGQTLPFTPGLQQPQQGGAQQPRERRPVAENGAANAGPLAFLAPPVLSVPIRSLPLLVGGRRQSNTRPAQTPAGGAEEPSPSGILRPTLMAPMGFVGRAAPAMQDMQAMPGAQGMQRNSAQEQTRATGYGPRARGNAPTGTAAGARGGPSAEANESIYITPTYIEPVWLGTPEAEGTVTERMPILAPWGTVLAFPGAPGASAMQGAQEETAGANFGIDALEPLSLSTIAPAMLEVTTLQIPVLTPIPSELPSDPSQNYFLASRILPWPVSATAVPTPSTPHINNGLLYGGGLGAIGLGNISALANPANLTNPAAAAGIPSVNIPGGR